MLYAVTLLFWWRRLVSTWSHIGFWYAPKSATDGEQRDKNPRSRIGKTPIGGAGNRWNIRYFLGHIWHCRCDECRVCSYRATVIPTTLEQCLTLFKRNRRSFRIISWPFRYTPGTVETVDFTQQTCSKQDIDCAIGKKCDGHCFFWNRPPRERRNGRDSELLGRFDPNFRKIGPICQKKKCSFAPAHTFVVTAAELLELGYKLLPQSPFSSDLPCTTSFCF